MGSKRRFETSCFGISGAVFCFFRACSGDFTDVGLLRVDLDAVLGVADGAVAAAAATANEEDAAAGVV